MHHSTRLLFQVLCGLLLSFFGFWLGYRSHHPDPEIEYDKTASRFRVPVPVPDSTESWAVYGSTGTLASLDSLTPSQRSYADSLNSAVAAKTTPTDANVERALAGMKARGLYYPPVPLRYFLITYTSMTKNSTSDITGNYWFSHRGFPTKGEIEKEVYRSFPHTRECYQSLIITNIFEFKDKQDYTAYKKGAIAQPNPKVQTNCEMEAPFYPQAYHESWGGQVLLDTAHLQLYMPQGGTAIITVDSNGKSQVWPADTSGDSHLKLLIK